jgi:isopenicillin N synthase-like dioxygenase
MSSHNAVTDTASDIPVIDLQPLAGGGAAGLHQVAVQIAAACEHTGFFYIRNHGVAQELIDAAFAESANFHALPLEQKMRIDMNPWHRGYMPLATSVIRTSSVARVRKPNQSESFMLMHELAADDPEVLAGKPLQGPNQWPDPQRVPDFRRVIQHYNATLQALSYRLVPVMAVALGLQPDFFDEYFKKPVTFLRLIHYPPRPEQRPDDLFGAAPHTDYGFFTILAQDQTGGLQIRQKGSGQWIPAPVIAGTFVVNIGDILARWSNDRFTSTPHRVINSSTTRDRYSIPFFFDPHMDTMVECLPNCYDADHPPRYEPVRYGDYLMHRLDANYSYRQQQAQTE